MNDVERGTCSLRRITKSWNILLNSLFDHLNEKLRFKIMGQETKEKDVAMIKWTLDMQECGNP
jgi:uncharacterized membrane protein